MRQRAHTTREVRVHAHLDEPTAAHDERERLRRGECHGDGRPQAAGATDFSADSIYTLLAGWSSFRTLLVMDDDWTMEDDDVPD